jgi:ATP phosphoribosyltransferase
MSNNDERLKLAVQKSGRLADESRKLLEKCGIRLLKSKDQLFCKAQNFPLDVFFVRDDDIPTFVASGTCHIGIVGQNVLFDEQITLDNQNIKDVAVLSELGFGECRLSLAVPNAFDYDGIKSLNGKRIATSYKGLLSQFLKDNNVSCEIITMQGAVEIAPRIDMADAVCDLVSTGTTLKMNGLKEVETILESQSVLVRNDQLNAAQEELLARFMLRLKGVQTANSSKYVMLHSPVNKLEEIKSVLPGSESPTVLSLQGRDDLVAVHAVCNEGIFWDTMEDLKARGASAILVLPIEKMLD